MKRWLDAQEHTEKADIIAGATMLLQLNRNNAMFNTIMRNPERYVDKIVYELNKFLPIRIAQMTIGDVKQLDSEITPVIKAAIETNSSAEEEDTSVLPTSAGKRADHDSLPEEIKNIWEENAERWKKIKEAYNTCLSLTEPCDRFEYLTNLKELWYKYKAEFERYDTYQMQPVTGENTTELTIVEPLQVAKDISNARSYISNNITKLADLKKKAASEQAKSKDVASYNALLEKVNSRVQILIANKQVIGSELNDMLVKAGIEVVNDDKEK